MPPSRRAILVSLLLALPLAVVIGFGWGYHAHRSGAFPHEQLKALRLAWVDLGKPPPPSERGRWRLRDGRRPWLTQDQVAYTWEQLQALGYAGGTEKATSEQGVLVRQPQAHPGLSLVTSGHGPEALLLDLDGEVVHEWRADAAALFPRAVVEGREPRPYYRRALMLPDGSLLGLMVGAGAFRLSKEGEILWTWEGDAHHDLALDGRGGVWVLAREAVEARAPFPDGPLIDEELVRLDVETGELSQRFSLIDALLESPHRTQLHGLRPTRSGDYLHTNTVRVLDGAFADRLPAFTEGRLLLSMRHLNLVLVVDPLTTSAVWAWRGPWKFQHEPVVVEPGNLLVFDNLSVWPRSRAIEVDPISQETVWVFDGGTKPLISETCGTVQRLPGGNTIAVASDTGRVVEVDRAGEVVWEWASPYRADGDRDLIATLFQAERLWGEALGPFAPAGAEPEPVIEGEGFEAGE